MEQFLYNNQVITNDNLKTFKEKLMESQSYVPYGAVDSITLADDVKLTELYPTTSLSNEAQFNINRIVGRIIYNQSERLPEFIKMVHTHPDNVHSVIRTAGNATGGYDLYSKICDAYEKSSFSDKLAIDDTLLKHNYKDIYRNQQTQPYNHLNRQDTRHFMSIMSQKNGEYTIRKYIESGVLLNCDNLPEDIRKKVNEYAFHNNSYLNLKAEFMDMEFLKKLVLKGHHIPKYNSSKNPTAQEKNNAGIQSRPYKNVKKALMREIRKRIPYNGTYNDGFKKLYSEIFNKEIKGLEDIVQKDYYGNTSPDTLFREVYLEATKKDIIGDIDRKSEEFKHSKGKAPYKLGSKEDNRADRLSNQAIEDLLANDKDNTFLRKIMADHPHLIANKKIKLNPAQQNIYNAYSGTHVSGEGNVVNSTKVSTKEKEAHIISAYQKTTDAIMKTSAAYMNKTEFEQYKQEVHANPELSELDKSKLLMDKAYSYVTATKTEIQNLADAHAQTSKILTNAEAQYDAIRRLQHAYIDIAHQFKNSQPNEQEAHLTSENVEKVMVEALAGRNSGLAIPQQKGLPLFGRQSEKNRRDILELKIHEFNKTLTEVQNIKGLSNYYGRILAESSLTTADAKVKLAKDNNTKARNAYNSFYNSEKTDDINQATTLYQTAVENGEILQQGKETIKAVAQSRSGVDTTSKLQNANTATGDEKRTVRALNKKVRDKLTDRANAYKGKTDAEKVQGTKKELETQKYNQAMARRNQKSKAIEI